MPTSDNDPAREKSEQEAVEVPFPGEYTWPKPIPLNPESGGFIHLAQTADQTTKKTWQTVNIWGPATTTLLGSKETNLTFLGGQIREIIDDDRFGGVQPLQYMKWMRGKMTRIIRFDCISTSDTAYIIKATVYELRNEQPSHFRKEIDTETAWKSIMKLELVGQADLLRHDGPLPADLANNMRVIPLKSSSSSADPNISVALVVSSKYSTSVQITIASLTIRDGTLSATIDEKTYNDISLPRIVKSFTGQDQEPGIMLVDFKPDPSIKKTSMVVEHIFPSTQSEWQRHTFEDTFDTTATSDAWSILTGNILSLPTQSTQLLALNSSFPYFQLRLYAHCPSNKSFHLLSTHTCTSSHTNSTFVHNHLTALLPSYPPAKPGLDVLDSSLLKTNNPTANPAGNGYKLLFRTHRRTTSNRTAGTPNFVSHNECFECTVTDNLAPYNNSGGYRSRKWLRTTAPSGFKSAILEIFTWYGGLGARLFAPPRRGRYGEYQLLGMRSLLEDGIGNRQDREGEGEGGEEVVSWGPSVDWVDSHT